jgi:hypothetical protein
MIVRFGTSYRLNAEILLRGLTAPLLGFGVPLV